MGKGVTMMYNWTQVDNVREIHTENNSHVGLHDTTAKDIEQSRFGGLRGFRWTYVVIDRNEIDVDDCVGEVGGRFWRQTATWTDISSSVSRRRLHGLRWSKHRFSITPERQYLALYRNGRWVGTIWLSKSCFLNR